MRRLGSLLLASLVLGACKIERTPQEFIDHRSPLVTLRQEAADELTARLLAMGQALSRGDSDAVLQGLQLAPDAYVVTAAEGAPTLGEDEIREAVEGYLARHEPLLFSDVQVTVGPRGNTAWFRAEMLAGSEGAAVPVRLTGVLVQGDEGRWQLAQAHLSRLPATAPPSYPAGADTPREGG